MSRHVHYTHLDLLVLPVSSALVSDGDQREDAFIFARLLLLPKIVFPAAVSASVFLGECAYDKVRPIDIIRS